VAVQSTPGGGSVFQLLLPLMPTTDPTSAHRGMTGQILQVDWLHG
jgi:hypothetical protein